MSTGGRPRKLPDDDTLREHLEAGMTQGDIARKYNVRQQSVSIAIRRMQSEGSEDRELPAWPWPTKLAHRQGRNYKAMVAYKRWSAGLQVTPDQLQLAKRLKEITDQLNCVITYDTEHGFVYTNRRPEDGSEMFVVRDPTRASG
ncbi:hypothetical protein [Lentzea sp. E54]|uniref:hypothetical protein n=1 Tax=Lentzea xerophila TaxID=3435883 RepID=UPI003DA59DB2